MSRLTDLIQAAKRLDARLGEDLEAEIGPLQRRLPFGLNFERHSPEAVELPGHPVRKGSKVRVLPPRGSTERGDRQLWSVEAVEGESAVIIERATAAPERRNVLLTDLVTVAEFRDPIYPGLQSTGMIERGGDKPFHTVINGENFHALKLLTFTHAKRVDAIFIDPPYNTRANDWKYNNDYVDPDDDYAHSRWLAFMERRLVVAKQLLNPDSSALIVSIDEKEYLRLGLLLEQLFPDAKMQMVTTIISAKGAVRRGQFSRVEEHLFFLTFGDAQIERWTSDMLQSYRTDAEQAATNDDEDADEPLRSIEWAGLRRREPGSIRTARPNQFYAIFVDAETGILHSISDAIADGVDRNEVAVPPGTKALWPLKPDGREMLWGLTPDALRRIWADGYARVNWNSERGTGTVYYLPSGTIARISSGQITVTGRAADGSVEGYVTPDTSASKAPKRVWNLKSHNSETGGTNLLSALLPGRQFPYPKSMYAVEDALRFVIGSKKDAVIVDFFAGSGTTAHATMRLNRQDDGTRQCILITNNEVSADEARRLRADGLRPGDADWEKHGICDWITKPRVKSAILGETPDGSAVVGRYRAVDEFPIAEGFKENAAFFTLTYESPWLVGVGRAFEAIAPLLWLRSGAEGALISTLDGGWKIGDTYAVLKDLDMAAEFVAAVRENESVGLVYIVTDDERRYQFVADDLPSDVKTVRLYEDYLRNFAIAVDA